MWVWSDQARNRCFVAESSRKTLWRSPATRLRSNSMGRDVDHPPREGPLHERQGWKQAKGEGQHGGTLTRPHGMLKLFRTRPWGSSRVGTVLPHHADLRDEASASTTPIGERMRTPGPISSASIRTNPAASKTRTTWAAEARWSPCFPPSKSRTVERDSSACSASCSCVQSRRPRAARHCAGVIFGMGVLDQEGCSQPYRST